MIKWNVQSNSHMKTTVQISILTQYNFIPWIVFFLFVHVCISVYSYIISYINFSKIV